MPSGPTRGWIGPFHLTGSKSGLSGSIGGRSWLGWRSSSGRRSRASVVANGDYCGLRRLLSDREVGGPRAGVGCVEKVLTPSPPAGLERLGSSRGRTGAPARRSSDARSRPRCSRGLAQRFAVAWIAYLRWIPTWLQVTRTTGLDASRPSTWTSSQATSTPRAATSSSLTHGR